MQTDFRVDIEDAIAGFDRARLHVVREVDSRLARGAQEVAREAKARAPKAESHLVNSINSTRERRLRYVVAPGVNYAGYVEEGSEPGGRPTVQSIMDWLHRKRIQPRAGRSRRDAAYLIARSIARQGIAPQPYLRPALETKRTRLHALVQEGVDAGITQARLA